MALLVKRLDVNVGDVRNVIVACCTLHNICDTHLMKVWRVLRHHVTQLLKMIDHLRQSVSQSLTNRYPLYVVSKIDVASKDDIYMIFSYMMLVCICAVTTMTVIILFRTARVINSVFVYWERVNERNNSISIAN